MTKITVSYAACGSPEKCLICRKNYHADEVGVYVGEGKALCLECIGLTVDDFKAKIAGEIQSALDRGRVLLALMEIEELPSREDLETLRALRQLEEQFTNEGGS